ncbi:CC domain-containing protein [Caenorhabditis elegans]|uniref:CC domain-containing protein n=1 Tax=Caenorhabditis elegans TaxID=6239 RepID=P91237_CAEEL|nr:CC domain-containing protein [Caenorhabditis elegans]CCD69001.1 CC domain-containing protein [Caenorhabditis elegans]|eukprot:NP_494363.1 Uncharacterized protein CELE_F08D12.3 [Caenorhabditis elegans]
MSRTFLTIFFCSAVAPGATSSASTCKSPTGPAIGGACAAGQVVIQDYCCWEDDVYKLPAESCKNAFGPAIMGYCSDGQVVVGDICCEAQDVYDSSTATCQEGKSVGPAGAGGSCPQGASITKGSVCCWNEGIQDAPASACKSSASPAILGICPSGQVLIGNYCCEAKDVYDPSTATCQRGYEAGPYGTGLTCPEGTSPTTKEAVCCYFDGIQVLSACKSSAGPAVFGSCPPGQVVVGSDCCEAKDVYDPSTATCQKNEDVGPAAVDGACPAGTSLTKGSVCCWNEGIHF